MKAIFRRKREGKTNYRKRFALIRSEKPRIIVRKSNKNIRIQFALYDEKGDRIVVSALGSELKKYGWNHSFSNAPAAYLTGIMAGRRAIEKGISEGVLDIGLQYPSRGGNLFSALKGLLDAGVEIPHSEEILPSEERIYGSHIDEKMIETVKEIKKKIEEEHA
ncbi:MAG: 50S ribosomal protein L18 [Thermoplasmatales archaeon]|nr:50S ribosomal protein L18 [Thermoplasmatales archaeon]